MLTVREAKQRCEVNRVRISRTGFGTEWRVTLAEWTREQVNRLAYFTDDLEDAVLTGSRLRRDAALVPA